MNRLPDDVLLDILAHPQESLRKIASRLSISTNTVHRIRRTLPTGGSSLKAAQSALYKPPLRVASVKPAIDFEAVIERRASGLTIKDCWRVYNRAHPDGFGLSAFSRLVKKHSAPEGFVPVGGPVLVPGSPAKMHWPESERLVADGEGEGDSPNPFDGVLSVDEDGCVIKVRYNELAVGKGDSVRRFMPATHGLRAIVVACEALVSTGVLRWCESQGVNLYIASRGLHPIRVFWTNTPSESLRRSQYGADALAMGRRLVVQKFALMRPAGLLSEVQAARSVEALRLVEARYSLAYWRSVSPLELRHYPSLPTVWRVWDGSRVSAISGVNSSATHPVNAMLNYAYGVLAARYEMAASAKGLDTSAACLHGEENARALVFDLIEFDRINLSKRLLTWIKARAWKRRDFRVGLNGAVFLEPHIAREVAAIALPGKRRVQEVLNQYCRLLRA